MKRNLLQFSDWNRETPKLVSQVKSKLKPSIPKNILNSLYHSSKGQKSVASLNFKATSFTGVHHLE